MKTIVGFIAVVFSVLIFAPSNTRMPIKEVEIPNFDKVENYHYIPCKEAIESRRALEMYERKIKANLTYLNSLDQ